MTSKILLILKKPDICWEALWLQRGLVFHCFWGTFFIEQTLKNHWKIDAKGEDAPKTRQEVPKTCPGCSKTRPRLPKMLPKRAQDAPRRSQDAPRRLGTRQDAPKTAPKTPQDAAKLGQNCVPKQIPLEIWILVAFGMDFRSFGGGFLEWILEVFGKEANRHRNEQKNIKRIKRNFDVPQNKRPRGAQACSAKQTEEMR